MCLKPRPVLTRALLARTMARLSLALLLLGLLPATAPARTGYPKVLNIFLRCSVTSADLQELAKWDVLVLDADFPHENPGAIDQIRALNPEIQILGYIPINGLSEVGYLRPSETVLHKYWDGVSADGFWLYDTAGGLVHDWPGKGSTNLTPNSPVNAQGQKYWQWFAHFVDDVVWQHGQSEWDGIFLDDVWNGISWLNSILAYPIDSDRNGVADPAAQLDAWWTAANDSCTALLRQLVGPGVPVMGNGANTCYGALNGTMIESFPYNGAADQNNIYGYAWTKWTLTYYGSYFSGIESFLASPSQFVTINSKWPGVGDQPDTTGRFNAHKRIGLATTLLGDGYYSLNNSLDLHASTWWEPEYDIYLGAPTGPPYSYVFGGLTIWRRDFAEVSVVVNPNNATLFAQADIPKIEGWDAYIGPSITTLATASIDSTSAVLRWTAPGDDGTSGTAEFYHGRIATYPINDANWASAPRLFWLPEPLVAGTIQSTQVTSLAPAMTYYVALRTEDDQANLSAIGNVLCFTTVYREPLAVDERPGLPEGVFAVGEVWPNPASGSMSLRVETGSSLTLSFEVFDLSGRIVSGPRFDTFGPGVGTVAWDGRDASGRRVPRGIYFVRMRGNDTTQLRRVWVLP
jgi:hypothetical protein